MSGLPDRLPSKGFKRWKGCLATFLFVLILVRPSDAGPPNPDAFELTLDPDKTTAAEEALEAAHPFFQFLDGRVGAAVLIELVYEFADVAETDDRQSGGSDDVFLNTIELGFYTRLVDWLETNVVTGIENIAKDGDDANVFLDEAIVKLTCPVFPVYFIGGRRTQPFGAFEDHLLSGTITEEVYEIIDEGATLGIRPETYGLDLSVTLHAGTHVRGNLRDFDTHDYRESEDMHGSDYGWILNATSEPCGDFLKFGVFYSNEQGDDARNQSLGGAVTVHWQDFTLDAEYITALGRERGEDGEENLENAWLLGLAFLPTDDLELAVRFEAFDDDRKGGQDEVVDYRCLAGFNYALCDWAIVSSEYRYTDFEKERGSEAASRLNEVLVQIAVEF
ncbi:MAG: hypothetical protein PVI39_11745 [Desulfobacteraceae bacterium]|jgi:hypothetical protein